MSDSALILAAQLWLEANLRVKVFGDTGVVSISSEMDRVCAHLIQTRQTCERVLLSRFGSLVDRNDLWSVLNGDGDVFSYYCCVVYSDSFVLELRSCGTLKGCIELLSYQESSQFLPKGLIEGFVLADGVSFSTFKLRPFPNLLGFARSFAISYLAKRRKNLILGSLRNSKALPRPHQVRKIDVNTQRSSRVVAAQKQMDDEVGFKPSDLSGRSSHDSRPALAPESENSPTDDLPIGNEFVALPLFRERVLGDLPLPGARASVASVVLHRVATASRPQPSGAMNGGDGFRYAELPHLVPLSELQGEGQVPSEEQLSLWAQIHSEVASVARSKTQSSPIPFDPPPQATVFNRERFWPPPSSLSAVRCSLLTAKVNRFSSSPQAFKDKHVLCVNSAYRILSEAERRGKKLIPYWEKYLALKAEIFFFQKNSHVPSANPRTFLRLSDFHPIRVCGVSYATSADFIEANLSKVQDPVDRKWFLLLGSSLSPNILDPREINVVSNVLTKFLNANRFAKGRRVSEFVPELSAYEWGVSEILKRQLRNPSTGGLTYLPPSRFDKLLSDIIIPASKSFTRFESKQWIDDSFLSEMLTELEGLPFLENLSRLICHVGLFSQNLTWTAWFSHLGLMALDLDTFVLGGGFLTQMVRNLGKIAIKRYQSASLNATPAAKFFTDQSGAFASSELGSSIFEILQSFSVVGFFSTFGVSGSQQLVKRTVEWLNGLLVHDGTRRRPIETLSDRLMKFIRVLLAKVKEAVEKKDFSLLFRDEISYDKWSVLVDTLINSECVRLDPARPAMESLFNAQQSAGFIHPRLTRQLTPQERSKELERVLEEGLAFEKRYVATPSLVALTRIKCSQIRSEIRNILTSTANSTYRQVPFGIFIHGVAGCGKTTLCSEIHACLSHHQGLVSDETSMYRIDMASNFHDSFAEGMSTVLFDDVDQSVAPESAAVMNHVQVVNKLINSAPYPMEKASVEQKGKFFANFLLALYSTNFEFANLRDRTMDTTQFWRRFPVSIHMKVREPFANSVGGIDRVAAYSETRLKEDIWEFVVSIFDPASASSTSPFDTRPYRVVATFHTKRELFSSLTVAFDEFARRERCRMMERAGAKLVATRCPFCSLSLEQHPNEELCSKDTIKRLEATSYAEFVFVTFFAICAYHLTGFFRELKSYWNSSEGIPFRAAFMVWFLTRFAGVGGALGIAVGLHGRSFRSSISEMASYAERRVWEPFLKNKGKILAGLAAAVIAVKVSQKYFASPEFVSRFQGASEPNSTGFPKRRDPWGRLQPKIFDREYARKKPTYTVEEMMTVLRRRIFPVRSRFMQRTNYATALGNGLVIFPRHLLESSEEGMANSTVDAHNLEFTVGNGVVYVTLDPERTWTVPTRDYVLSYIPELPVFKDGWNILNELPEACLAFGSRVADQAWLVTPEKVISYGAKKLHGVVGRIGLETRVQYSWGVRDVTENLNGMCGCPVVARIDDRFYLVGVHQGVAGTQVLDSKGVPVPDPQDPSEPLLVNTTHFAESLSRKEMSHVFVALKRHQPSTLEIVTDPEMIDPSADVLRFESLPDVSSLKVSLSEKGLPFIVFGTYKGPVKFGGTMKTNVVPTKFKSDLVREFALASGVSKEFCPPVFRGRMIDVLGDPTKVSRYLDPHCRSMESYINVSGDARVWRNAMDDYLHGIQSLSGFTGYVPLSDYATVVGIPETRAYSFDLSTSAGPPFYSSKKVCIKVQRDASGEPGVWFDPELQKGINRILEVIDAGDVYSPPAVHCLKDEVVSKPKVQACKIRVFNIMPLAFNFLLKKFLSPIVDFFRSHPFFFEHAIGLNIAGLEDATRMYHFLKVHPNICASDVSDFDVSASTRELHYSSLVVMHLAHLLGYSPTEKKRVWGLLMSSSHVTHVSKGDFFLTNFGLASGYWITLFLNCVRNSLQARYAYYRLAPGVPPPFRSVVNQLVLGDDNISCVSPTIPWFNQVDVAKALLEIGAKRTSSRKGFELIPYEKFSDATFLKRVFTLIDGVVYCPIEKDTLVRMLSYRKKSPNVSEHDHHCVILSTFLAESFLWGEEYFRRASTLASSLVDSLALSGPSLRLDTFEGYKQRYEGGSLVTWSPLMDDEPQQN
jgi:hypothetical protein